MKNIKLLTVGAVLVSSVSFCVNPSKISKTTEVRKNKKRLRDLKKFVNSMFLGKDLKNLGQDHLNLLKKIDQIKSVRLEGGLDGISGIETFPQVPLKYDFYLTESNIFNLVYNDLYDKVSALKNADHTGMIPAEMLLKAWLLSEDEKVQIIYEKMIDILYNKFIKGSSH